ncbi:MAG: hypothetical protein ACRESK_05275 [Gammaproteobacteria bacterium]
MTPTQIKLIIFAIRSIDWVLIAALTGYLIYAYLNSHSANYLVTVGIIGLAVIHQVGIWAITKIAYFRQTLKRLETPVHIR